MSTENTKYERIEDYLAGNLQGEALEQFEREVQNDPALAAEVALFRDMATALQPSQETALRANLDLLGHKHVPQESVTRPWWTVAAVLLIAALIGWLWKSLAKEQAPSPHKPAIEEKAPPVATEGHTTTPPPNSPTTQQTIPEKQQPEKPTQLAANFQPNPQLEALVSSQLRGDTYSFRILQPTANAALKVKNDRAVFLLSGVLETTAAQVDSPFRVLLFSNKPADYENFNFLFSRKLAFEKNGDAFRFRFEEPLDLSPGLYYYLIEAEDSGTLFHVGKVKVQ